jgi:hypothetical protein
MAPSSQSVEPPQNPGRFTFGTKWDAKLVFELGSVIHLTSNFQGKVEVDETSREAMPPAIKEFEANLPYLASCSAIQNNCPIS